MALQDSLFKRCLFKGLGSKFKHFFPDTLLTTREGLWKDLNPSARQPWGAAGSQVT
ncbi:hypothetical protein TRIP_B200660 [uncultured Desulfatiglans sp.]|uniref:Uncharacterized protein n=1 Tax=Uncultured Desulfatiglans sp. TaxID=1748965 RepID=A0A653A3C2_UNCDX|nr:hypothetical protein TRIP_B200660 [uncultured Desulfatiglans sp.]